jgi:radical SAM superfamily enzyme YgiQ (UPF0313 family)
MARVVLVNPSNSTLGFSFITPRWLFVIAEATPVDLVGDPILLDETIEKFNPETVRPDDIVGIGISSGNCLQGYRVLKQVKQRGATVIMGGIHATIFPDEPLEMGADAVVTGNGDVVWRQAIEDAVEGRLRKQYAGGRVPGEGLLKARWDLLDSGKYVFPSVQTVAGCPENCSFCSVWVTDGRQPRRRLSDKIIEEANELYELGFRCIILADDNFNPATIGRIAREPSEQKRRELERVREERLQFFDEYDRRVPPNLFAFTQMTTEVVSDDEYLSAMYKKMRIRGALIGVESFSEDGLRSAGKLWNPVGKKMLETIEKIQANGIWVLSSIICGLESDTIETIRTMRQFALDSGAVLSQFTLYGPYPGTKDFYEMMQDKENFGKPGYVPKHKTRILHDRFWQKPLGAVDITQHASISRDALLAENRKCWSAYYSLREGFKRVLRGAPSAWPWAGRIAYLLGCVAFKKIYEGQGIAADSVSRKKMGTVPKFFVRSAVKVFSYFYRRKRAALRPAVIEPERAA